MKREFVIVVAMLAGAKLLASDVATVGFVKIDGAIGPATASYLARATEVSAQRQDECLVIQLDTPGGLLDSTKQIVQSFYAAKIPTVVYVAPSGANAGSAGCFITLAADIAAMAPNTSIGAAHPVALSPTSDADAKGDTVMKQKLENFATSYIEAIAQKRGRNVEWAKTAVRDSASITAEKALELRVIDLIAKDLPDLLAQLNRRAVNGKTLHTAEATVTEIPMLTQEKIFHRLWRPEVMFILMLLAIYGLLGELSNPGAILPGVVGAIALILVLYMGTVLPINIAGVALLVLAVGLFVADVYASSHGVLTVGGIVAFLLGALMLFNRAAPGFRLSLAVIIPATVVTALFFIFIVGAGLRAQFLPVRAGRETLLGKVVPARERIDTEHGQVFVEGELWNAVSEAPVAPDQPVEIIAVEGLTLRVKPHKPRGAL